MITNDVNPPIVVGLDGSENGLRALHWAAEVASVRRWPVRLVNVFEQGVPDLPIAPLYGKVDLENISDDLLADAQSHARSQFPNLVVEVVGRIGPPAEVLLDELTRGRMLVLGRRGIGRFTALLLGSTSLACSSRAVNPVVVIPPIVPNDEVNGLVVVGIDGSARDRSAVEFAFMEASLRGARLDIVHAWELPSLFALDHAAYSGREMWETAHRISAAEVVAGHRDKYPDVETDISLEYDHAAAAMVRRAAHADLLVVGGRGHGQLVGALMGSTTNAVIQHAPCPVAVVHQIGDPRP